MYSYGQFCKTPIGRMRVRKKKTNNPMCRNCFFHVKGSYNICNLGYDTCMNTIPLDAYFEKPNVGGKDQHK